MAKEQDERNGRRKMQDALGLVAFYSPPPEEKVIVDAIREANRLLDEGEHPALFGPVKVDTPCSDS